MVTYLHPDGHPLAYCLTEIESIDRARGGLFFTPLSTDDRGRIVYRTVYCGPGGYYFVSADDLDGHRRFRIHRFDPEAVGPCIQTLTSAYRHKGAAVNAARNLSAGRGGRHVD